MEAEDEAVGEIEVLRDAALAIGCKGPISKFPGLIGIPFFQVVGSLVEEALWGDSVEYRFNLATGNTEWSCEPSFELKILSIKASNFSRNDITIAKINLVGVSRGLDCLDFLETQVFKLVADDAQRLITVRTLDLNKAAGEPDDGSRKTVSIFENDEIVCKCALEGEAGESGKKEGSTHGLKIGDPIAKDIGGFGELKERRRIEFHLEVTQNGGLAGEVVFVRRSGNERDAADRIEEEDSGVVRPFNFLKISKSGSLEVNF